MSCYNFDIKFLSIYFLIYENMHYKSFVIFFDKFEFIISRHNHLPNSYLLDLHFQSQFMSNDVFSEKL